MYARATILSCLALSLLLMANPGHAREAPSAEELAANRDRLIAWQESEQPTVEFYTDSADTDDGAETKIALVIEGVDAEEANQALAGAGDWCQIVFLHLNVKTCINGESGSDKWMHMYMGRKFYEPPEKAEQIELEFNSGVTDDNVLWVTLTADEGPFNTSDYFVGLYAVEVEERLYAQLHSSQKVSKAITGFVDVYMNTFGRKKIGFSVVGTDRKGNPKYSTGNQAMLERNVVRYLLALRAYLETHSLEGTEGMLVRAAAWYDATDAYREQLYEVDREDYLRDKEKEYQHMLELQAEAASR